MKNPLSLIKSTFHDIRCCDENSGTQTDPQTGISTSWRAFVSSLTCLLDSNGKNTGYVHCQTLEEYDIANNQPTGVTSPNIPSHAGYIPDYLDTSMCAIAQEQPQTAILYASNNCTGILVVEMVNEATQEAINFDVNPNQSLTKIIPVGVYKIIMHCSQQQPAPPAPALHVLQTVNSITRVLQTEALYTFEHIPTGINITCRPTTQAIS